MNLLKHRAFAKRTVARIERSFGQLRAGMSDFFYLKSDGCALKRVPVRNYGVSSDSSHASAPISKRGVR